MPISRERARQIVERAVGASDPHALKERLAPVPPSEVPLSPPVPSPMGWGAEARDARLEFLRRRGVATPHLAGEAERIAPEEFRGNIENYIGMVQVPVGLIGPLRVSGLHVREDVYVPLATTEGALVASYHRGARLLSRRSGTELDTAPLGGEYSR